MAPTCFDEAYPFFNSFDIGSPLSDSNYSRGIGPLNATPAPFDRIEYPELLFGLVAPIGVDLDRCRRAIRAYFEPAGYKIIEVKVTDVFDALRQYIPPDKGFSSQTHHQRLTSYIRYGNKIRAITNVDNILAAITIRRIMQYRLQHTGDKAEKTLFVLHQFKRREEIELLRSVYGRVFFQVSVYSRRGARVDNLSRRFAHDENKGTPRVFRDRAERIVQIDENEIENKHGQRISEIFHDADFIVNYDVNQETIDAQINRFCDLLFGSNSKSPTKDEYGMFVARAAALQTLDLSRQVGAAIYTPRGEIISMGTNEVPKAGGGPYLADDALTGDDRDFVRGYDSNQRRKDELLNEVLGLVGARNVSAKVRVSLKASQFMDALEYGRVVHAEMSAITEAARLGRSIAGATLYCTTFPCHLCAKQIVSAGVARVVFLEPYPKSLTAELHVDSTRIEGADRGRYEDYAAVDFSHFHGVSPRRYREFFERSGRKESDTGDFREWREGKPVPMVDLKFPFYLQLERNVADAVSTYLRPKGVKLRTVDRVKASYVSE